MPADRSSTYAIGVDFGTNSVRALIIDTANGNQIAYAAFDYPTGDNGIILDSANPNLARQHPPDYMIGVITVIKDAVAAACCDQHFTPEQVVGIGVDATSSTPLPVDKDGLPLACQKQFREHPEAQAWLWRDHSAYQEAADITAAAREHAPQYLAICGGTYSSEWYWAKILHCKRIAPDVFHAADSWVELADFIPAYLTNNTQPRTMPRGICAAGHKALYHHAWNGLPSKSFLATLDPDLAPLRDRYTEKALPCSARAGTLCPAIADKIGLPPGIPVAVGGIDAHLGGVGAGVKPGTFVKIMGTSTCDIGTWPLHENAPNIPGICGIAPDSVIPGMHGLEAGQVAVGDIFNWFVKQVANNAAHETEQNTHQRLTEQAAKLTPGQSGLLALDWNNGNRNVLVDPLLTGLLVGQTLQTTAAEIYRALIEATAFGALTIFDRIEQHGIEIRNIIACGGIAEKNPLLMQIYADICNRPFNISTSPHSSALGAAMFAAVAGGVHPNIQSAQQAMAGRQDTTYTPDPHHAEIYAQLYGQYRHLHDAFSANGPNAATMKNLIALRDRTRSNR